MLHATPDGGVAVSILGPVSATLPGGWAINVSTEYPFDDDVTITLSGLPAGALTAPLVLRIPSWASNATLSVNGAPPTPLGGANGTMLRVRWPPGATGPTATVVLATEVGVIDLHPPGELPGVLALEHDFHDLVLQQPGGGVGHAELAEQFQRGDVVLGQRDQIGALSVGDLGLGLLDGTADALLTGSEHEFSAKESHQLAAFDREAIGHGQNAPVALGGAGESRGTG
jgi:hypothetical protein